MELSHENKTDFNTKEYLSEYRNRIQEYMMLLDISIKCKRLIKANTPSEQKTRAIYKLNSIIPYMKRLKTYFMQYTSEYLKTLEMLNRPDYKKILKYRYISGWKWQNIQNLLYQYESDYEYEPEKYKDKVMQQHRQALKALQKTIYQNDDKNVYKFIANTIFDNKKVSEIFNEKYRSTYIYNYLWKIHNKRINTNG